MKTLIIITSFFLVSNALSFTLNPSTGEGYNTDSIDIYIANNDCTGANFTVSEYEDMIKNAVDDYWNKVPTSALELNVKGIDTTIDLSSDTHATGLTKVAANTILAGCNANTANGFDDGSILGSAVQSCSSGTCRAILLLNAHTNSKLNTMSRSEIEVVIAHEIGHAFGLGHSEYEFNLMYYAVGSKYQKWLGMDDINGVSYLYPLDNKAELLGIPILGNCGTIQLDSDKAQNSLTSTLLGLFLALILFKIIRKKQRFHL